MSMRAELEALAARSRRRRRMLMVFFVALGVVAIAAGALGGALDRGRPQKALLDASSLRFVAAPPRVWFGDLAWDPGQRRLIAVGFSGRSWGDAHLYSSRIDGSDVRRLPVADNRRCGRTEQRTVQVIGDGRIAFVQTCLDGTVPPDQMNAIGIYDPRSGKTSRYGPYYLGLWRDALAFSPDDQIGLYAGGTIGTASLYRLGPTRLERLPLPVSYLTEIVWSPDGRQFATDGVPASEGEWDIWSNLTWKLYIGSRNGEHFRTLDLALTDAARLAWSPDGRWLAFVSSPRGQHRGLWVTNVQTGTTRLLLESQFLASPAWLPEGDLIVTNIPGITRTENTRIGYYVIPRRILTRYAINR
jgi:hypothetical protein